MIKKPAPPIARPAPKKAPPPPISKRARKPTKPKAPPPSSAPKDEPPKDRRGTPKGRAALVGPRGGRIGNPPFEPTPVQRAIVETHAAVGTQHELIAELMGISPDTLVRHFPKELRLGRAKINARIGANVARKALDGSAKHEFFWLKTRAGYTTKQEHEHSGPGGTPLELNITPKVDLSRLSIEDLRIGRQLALKAEGNASDPA